MEPTSTLFLPPQLPERKKKHVHHEHHRYTREKTYPRPPLNNIHAAQRMQQLWRTPQRHRHRIPSAGLFELHRRRYRYVLAHSYYTRTGRAVQHIGLLLPGIVCPSGYSTACAAGLANDVMSTLLPSFNFQYPLVAGEMAFGCCPT